MIEKRITHQMLEAGALALTPHECLDLTLPEHSTIIDVDLEGEAFKAQWSGRSRHLGGEMLSERLQDYGQVGGLLRLRLVDAVYRLLLLPPGAAHFSQPAAPPVAPPKSVIAQKSIRRRATVDRQFHSDDEYDWGSGNTPTVGFLSEARRLISEQLKAAGFDALELVELRLQGEELATLDDFEELLAVDVANVDRMPHQEAVARHALSRLRGRAVLADEVGLGKTIEAGLAIKELTLRGLAKRVLILCPAPLRDQWRDEMSQKFDLSFDVAYRGPEVANQEKLILSLTLGAREVDKLTNQPWDIVIVDEAHRAAGAGARKRRELITGLTSACRYAFFLTATPVQNDLLELYRLVELLRPGTFTSVSEFKRKYVTRYDPRTPNDPAALRRLISSAMIRTTRAQAGVDRVERKAIDVPVTLGARERELYALSTDLLRNVMRDSSDTMRRRSLALRLTASPFSMGTTAFRMAERHGDQRVRHVLNEIAHLAMDIKGSARENKALEITNNWVREHGRVLIFTQHTDTVTGLLRRMEAEGLPARSFHGSMSNTERAATIAAFRAGDAPIMISTDAGAEGQNLQFCNCVLNYDLPWNPMRIEQRIGRVDRLTQPRDEVFIANLYARGTIDESVYQLLAKKLRMFELLFGQVTTILGELDESKSASFETRVMEALFAENDPKMERLLAELGTELVDAREKASTLIAADSGLSSWMASASEHRKGLTKAGASELMPEVTERARMRQRRVQTWVRQVLQALGAESIHDTGDEDGAFITVQFDEELADELGGRTVMHLAFDRSGMENHPDAELCAVGSPVFDELLGLLRMRGDMHATIPDIPEDLGPSPFRHAASTTLVRRRLVPTGTWSGHATFRATVGEAETTEHIITAELDGTKERRLPRRPLRDGEALPVAFDVPGKVVAAFERKAMSQLEGLRRDRAKQIEQDQAEERDRIQSGYNAQIAEAATEDKGRLRRALDSEERRLSRRPDVRARAKLLALILDEDDWAVEETWAGRNGGERTLTYEWGFKAPPTVESDGSGESIAVLAICAAGHWVDESELTCCDSCDHDLCNACGDDAVLTDCPVCGVTCCGECRTTTAGLCLRCAKPERAPELDEQFAVAWRLNREATILVSERATRLMQPEQSVGTVLVRDEDVDDRDRIRMRSYAIQNGLPVDSGLALRDLTKRPSSHVPTRVQLRSATRIEIEFASGDNATSSINGKAVAELPEHEAPAVIGEGELRLVSLLNRLRRDVPPPSPPSVVVTRRSRFTDLYLESTRVVEQVSLVADDGTLGTIDEQSAALQWRAQSVDATLAEAELGGVKVSLERRNDAVLITARDGSHGTASQWVALPDGTSAVDQLAWFEILHSLGVPGGRVGRRTGEAPEMGDAFPSPTECQLVDRSVRPVAELAEVEAGIDLVPAASASLAALASQRDLTGKQLPARLPPELNYALLEKAERPFTTVVRNGFEIHETWRGHGTATHQYLAYDALPALPKLDDLGTHGRDFGVCRDGHFYSVGSAALCASCATWACRACDDLGHRASTECPTCSAQVCQRCLSSDHLAPAARCVLCADTACIDCGRDPQVLPCTICDRAMCASCRVQELCPACNRLGSAPNELLTSLPSELAILGASVLAGSDDNATTILLNRGDGIEQAVVRNGSIDRWVAFGRSEIDDTYRLRLLASRELKAQVVPVLKELDVETPITTPHIVVVSERTFHPTWSVPGLGASGRSTRLFADVSSDLTRLIADEFPLGTQLPAPVRATPRMAQRAIARLKRPRNIPLEMRWLRVCHDLAIVDTGILDRTIDGPSIEQSVIPWTDMNATRGWVAESWYPEPTVRASATAKSVEAVVVGMASLLALGVRVDDRSEWYTISGSPQAPAATALARWMGLPDADEVSIFTDPTKVVRSSISNSMGVELSVQPAGNLKSGIYKSQDDLTFSALDVWMPSAEVHTPPCDPLTPALRGGLERHFNSGAPRTRIEIGARVEEIVTVEGGHVWRHELNLAPGQTDARRIDSITGRPRETGVIDREGHFGADEAQCQYCNGKTCSLCAEGLVSCDCCSAAICKRCVQEPHPDLWLCVACATLRPPSRSEAREHGRLLSTRRMLIGTDSQHTVVVEHAKHHWARQGEGSEKSVIASPSVGKFLDERLEGGVAAPRNN